MIKHAKIFYVSLFLWSCDPKRPVILFSLETDKGLAHPYLVEGVNKKTGELSLKTLPDVSLQSPALKNAVCVTPADYSYGNYLFKRWYHEQN